MKKYYFILAAAALGFASCSNDETIESAALSESNEINFRSLMDGVTRAVDVNTDNLTSFNVTAFRNTTPSPTAYFANVKFTKDGEYYTSNPKYYWPASDNLNFYAWSAHAGETDAAEEIITGDTKQLSGTYDALVLTPSPDATKQADLVYAKSENVAKAATIPLTFTHAGSRIVLKVKNTSANVSFAVTGWRLGFMAPSGTYNGSPATPTWSSLGTADADKKYDNTFSLQTIAGNTTTASEITGAAAQIMIPQSLTPVSAYASGELNAKPNNAYIAVQYTAKNTAIEPNEDIVAAATWAMWKIPAITWEAGKQYTYTIDLADGGYYETNTAAGTGTALDPILGYYIQFASVTVSNWDTSTPDINAGF